MSHVANVKLEVHDLDALREAVGKIDGLTWCEGQTTYQWYGKWLNDWHGDQAAADSGFDPATFGQCEHAIKADGATYEIGVVPNPTGKGYRLIYDNFASGSRIANRYGADLGTIKDRYAERVATRQLQRQGFRCRTTRNANGQLVVTGRK